MANNVNINPAYIDTAGGDVTISSGIVTVSLMSLTDNAGAAKKVVFIDNDSNVVAVIQAAANGTSLWDPAEPFCFQNGLIYDDSASSVANNDIVLVYRV